MLPIGPNMTHPRLELETLVSDSFKQRLPPNHAGSPMQAPIRGLDGSHVSSGGRP